MLQSSTSHAGQIPAGHQLRRSDAPVPISNSEAISGKSKTLRTSSAVAYEKDARLFVKGGGTIPCDALALQKYIWFMRNKLAPTSLYRRCMAVRHAHHAMGHKSPTDDLTLRPLLRALQLGYTPDKTIVQSGVTSRSDTTAKLRKPRPSLPITRRLLGQMLLAPPRNAIDRRDRALMLLAFAGALKRGTLVAINVGDLRFTVDALIVQIRNASNEGVGEMLSTAVDADTPAVRRIAIPITGGDMCAATAVKELLLRSALDLEPPASPLFRSGDRGSNLTGNRLESAVVSLVVKKWIAAAGIDPKLYSAQSLVTGRRSEFAKGVL